MIQQAMNCPFLLKANFSHSTLILSCKVQGLFSIDLEFEGKLLVMCQGEPAPTLVPSPS
jgi:hypothetical protein